MSKDIRLGIVDTSVSKSPVLQYANEEWRLWTAYNSKLSEGTYISLGQFGKMERVTIYPDGTIASTVIPS